MQWGLLIPQTLAMKKKLRKITISESEYLWRCKQYFHTKGLETALYRSETTLTIYSSQANNCKLHVKFISWEDAIGGNPLFTGMPIRRDKLESPKINLNKPRYVREVLDYILAQNLWDDQKENSTVLIEKGMNILRQIGYDVFEDNG